MHFWSEDGSGKINDEKLWFTSEKSFTWYTLDLYKQCIVNVHLLLKLLDCPSNFYYARPRRTRSQLCKCRLNLSSVSWVLKYKKVKRTHLKNLKLKKRDSPKTRTINVMHVDCNKLSENKPVKSGRNFKKNVFPPLLLQFFFVSMCLCINYLFSNAFIWQKYIFKAALPTPIRKTLSLPFGWSVIAILLILSGIKK